MAIEKLKLDEIVTNTFPHHATRKINEIIDHINSQATTPATKVDLAGNDGKERYGVDMLYAFLKEKGLLEE